MRRTTHVVVQQTLEALVDGDRFELVRDDHANEGTHGGVHAARGSSDIDDCHSLVLATHTSHHSLTQHLNNETRGSAIAEKLHVSGTLHPALVGRFCDREAVCKCSDSLTYVLIYWRLGK